MTDTDVRRPMPEADEGGAPVFWKSSGLHLVERNDLGWLSVTPDFVLAYLTRPEVHPIETSCAREIALHEALLADPFRPVTDADYAGIADADAVENYKVVLAFRDRLLSAGTIEGAYLDIMRGGNDATPPVFIDQLVHVIATNLLVGTRDPIRLRAAEILFRTQSVSTTNDRLMFADEEIVSMHAQTGESGLAQLLSETGTPMRDVELDVLDEENADLYWARSDRFDMVVDMRFEQPALDAFARVTEQWLLHLTGIETRIEPRPRLDDTDWRWHIGLDAIATGHLNRLFAGETLSDDEIHQIVALFRMTISDEDRVIDALKGRPIYMALAMDEQNLVRMKPQNLLTNLPLVSST